MSASGFDPDGPGMGEGLFGLGHGPEDARLHVIPVPWEATASYGRGARWGPEVVLAASQQVDLFDLEYGDFWRAGIHLLDVDTDISAWSDEVEAAALAVIASGGARPDLAAVVDRRAGQVHERVREAALGILDAGRIPAVLGGDHSAAYGLIRAVAERYGDLGILQIDAHADLRDGYMGFRWSHASVMHNALELPQITRLVGVGWRDLGAAEVARARRAPDRIRSFDDVTLARWAAGGRPWLEVVEDIVAALPPRVYVSFDVDGLDPALCPHTGTPVPGGLSWRQAHLLLAQVSRHRRVVGFDLCEVSPGPAGPQTADEWDGNVGARLLYKLAGCALRSGAD